MNTGPYYDFDYNEDDRYGDDYPYGRPGDYGDNK